MPTEDNRIEINNLAFRNTRLMNLQNLILARLDLLLVRSLG